jgi:hypothetical protein
MNADRFKYKEITDIILRSYYEAYNELGGGFLESVYENALFKYSPNWVCTMCGKAKRYFCVFSR